MCSVLGEEREERQLHKRRYTLAGWRFEIWICFYLSIYLFIYHVGRNATWFGCCLSGDLLGGLGRDMHGWIRCDAVVILFTYRLMAS